MRSRNGTAYDERTGAEVRGRKLRQDYYTKVWTTDPDDAHPQDFVTPPGPDGLNRAYGPAAQHAIPSKDVLGDFLNTVTCQMERLQPLSLNPGFTLEGGE